jgi:ubiquinone/menaquinone biosynthesis C-methylase UbiE
MSVTQGFNQTSGHRRAGVRRPWRTPPQLEAEELLDQGFGTNGDAAASLGDMWRLNFYLGGFRALTTHLYPRVLNAETPVTLVDLGTGSAQMLLAITSWARERQLEIHCMGIDWSARNLAVARRYAACIPDITLIHADALSLPILPNRADYLISSLFLHHFPPERVTDLLCLAYATARRGIIMSDLVRGWLSIVGFRVIRPLFARNFMTWHDGELSIRRAYTPTELLSMARAAGLSHATVHSHWPWRMTLVADK